MYTLLCLLITPVRELLSVIIVRGQKAENRMFAFRRINQARTSMPTQKMCLINRSKGHDYAPWAILYLSSVFVLLLELKRRRVVLDAL